MRRYIDADKLKKDMCIPVTISYDETVQLVNETIDDQPTADVVEVVQCKDCRKHNVSVGYQKDCCPLFEWRGVSYGHEHDYQYCCYAERRTDD